MNLIDKLNRIGYPPAMGERIVTILPDEMQDTLENIDDMRAFRAELRRWIAIRKDSGEWYPHP